MRNLSFAWTKGIPSIYIFVSFVFARFLGTEPFEESLRVSISDLSNLQVELYMEEQLSCTCTLYFVPTFPDQVCVM